MKKKIIRNIIYLLIFLSILIITFYIIFKNNNIIDIIDNIKKVNIFYIVIAIMVMFIFSMCEGINIRRVLRTLNVDISFIMAFKYALVGFFFSSITPSASGGDLAQLYFMHKDKVPTASSALALMVELASFQFISCILGIIGFIFSYNLLVKEIGNIKYLMILGIIVNSLILLVLIIMIFAKKFALVILNIAVKILKVFKYKKIDEFENKMIDNIEKYHKCSVYLKNNKKVFYKILFTSLCQLFLYHSIPYFVYLSFGLNDYNILTFTFIQAAIYISVSYLPFPGAMGISEGSFMICFKLLFPTSILSSAMIISRGISFYLFIIISGLLIGYFIIKKNILVKRG